MERHPLDPPDSAGGPHDATHPPCIWAHPCNQSQTTTLLNPLFLTIDTENQKDSMRLNSNTFLDNTF